MPFLHFDIQLHFSPNASFIIIFAVVCYTGCEWCHECTIWPIIIFLCLHISICFDYICFWPPCILAIM